METSTLAALASILVAKLFEKTGEAVSEQLSVQTNNLLEQIKIKSPNTSNAIESANQQTLDIVQVVNEVELIAKDDKEFANQLNKIRHLAGEELLAVDMKEREDAIVLSSKPTPPMEKLADKVGVYNEGGTVSIETFNF